MAIFLIRHTTPLSPEGVCYGQTDLPAGPSFVREAEQIRERLVRHGLIGDGYPDPVRSVYCSPLDRCLHLARYLWPGERIHISAALKEMNFGAWENKPWDQIDAPALQEWMDNFVHAAVPGGESYRMLLERCAAWWDQTIVRNDDHPGGDVQTTGDKGGHTVIITHAGVIRSLLCHCMGQPLSGSFQSFPVPFGAVYRLYKEKGDWKNRLL